MQVTVCIPTYNGATHLSECLDSVFAQTYADYDVLIVDDCSSDSTLDIVARYRGTSRTVRVHRNEQNLGLVGNWCRCVQLAGGEWIKFVFQDDILHPDCLSHMVGRAQGPLVFCKRQFLFASGTDPAIISKYNAIPSLRDVCGSRAQIEPTGVAAAILRDHRNFFGEPTAALIHRSLFTRFGYFNRDLRQICDLEYWIRVATNVGLVNVDEELATFRYHGSSTSAKNHNPNVLDRIELFDDLILLHEFAYNRLYGNVRKAGRSSLPKRNFKAELANKAHWMGLRAAAQAHSEANPDPLWLDDWERLAARYPHLNDPFRQAVHRIRDLWQRHVGWRHV